MNRSSALRTFLFLIAFAVGMTCCIQQGLAQAISGDLVGTCTDDSGAAIAGATITLANIATDAKYVQKSKSGGDYHFVNLPVGKYLATVDAAGFETKKLADIEVVLNRTSTLNFTLKVGSVETNVEVSTAAITLDTTSAQLQSSFDTKAITELPTASVGSGVLNMALMNAGIAQSGGLGLGSGPSVGGQRPYNNNYTIEGVDNNNKSVTGPLITVPNDAVSNLTVLQNQFSPEFGHSTGGQFNQVITSGTNSFHGRAYEYFQNRNLNATDYALEYGQDTKVPKPRYDNNRFGGQIGGPILKDKLFFFQNFEYNPVGSAAGATAVLAPTSDGFTALHSISGLSSTNLGILEKYLPKSGAASGTISVNDSLGNAVSIPVGTLQIAAPNYTNSLTAVTAIDYTLSTKDSIRGRYIYYKQDAPDSSPSLPVFYGTNVARSHLLNLSEYHSFSPFISNEFRIGFNRYFNDIPSPSFNFPGLDQFPSFNFSDLNLQFGPNGNAPEFTIINTYQVIENLAVQRGKHDLRFGVEGRKYISPQSFVQRQHGDYEYSFLNDYLHDLSPDIIGERSVGVPVYYGDQVAFYWYANDNWRVRPNITLNAGIRYEYTTVPYSERLQKLNSIADVPGLITFGEPTSSKKNFAPRVGVAWAPKGRETTSIRAGFGLGYDVIYDNIGITSLPPEMNVTEDVPSLTEQTANFLANGGLPGGSGKLQTFATPAEARAATSAAIPNHLQTPYSIQWNAGIQHSFAKDFLAEVRYVGTRGIHLNYQDRINRQPKVTSSSYLPTYLDGAPTAATAAALPLTLATLKGESNFVPAFAAAGFDGGNLTEFVPHAGSSYNGLQTQLNKRYSQGLQLQVAYTWSKNIDNATSDFYANDLDPRRSQNSRNPGADRALSSLDRRHRLTLMAVYDVPWYRTSKNWFFHNVLGNYTVAPFYTFESPEHYTVQSGTDSNMNGDAAGDRVIWNPNGKSGTGSGVTEVYDSTRAGLCPSGTTECDANLVAYYANNPSAQYVQAKAGALATAGRNTQALPHINNIDLSVSKVLSFGERYRFQFTAQTYNLFNNHQFIPGRLNDVASKGGFAGNFLHPQSSTFNLPYTVFSSNPRTMQLAAKIIF